MIRKTALFLALLLLLTSFPAFASGNREMLEKASDYAASGDYEKAIASYQLAQRLEPDDPDACLGEASVHLLLGDFESAAALIGTALEIDPVSEDAWYLKCLTDVLSGDMEAFEEDSVFASVCGVEIASDPASLGALCAEAGFFGKASEYFAQADIGALTPEQCRLYKKTLIQTGQEALLETLALPSSAFRDEVLDAAFEAGELSLTETELPAVSAEDFVLVDEMWTAHGVEIPEDPYAMLEEDLESVEITPFSCSPSGNSGLYLFDDVLVCMYEDEYRIAYPSETRGAADEYGNLEKYMNALPRSFPGREGVVYSPDGRYAAACHYEMALIDARYFIDPILIDLSTGEVFLTATYASKVKEDNAGVATTACFSADGRYFYYMLYGKMHEHLTALYRYDLTTGETEFCCSASDCTYYPTLWEMPDGELIILEDTIKNVEHTGVAVYSEAHGEWTFRSRQNPLPMENWYSKELLYSKNSGYAFAAGRIAWMYGETCFQCFRPGDDFEGMDRYYAVSPDGSKLLDLSADEVAELSAIIGPNNSSDLPDHMQTILCARLSPDGYYALLMTWDSANEAKLYLVRLEDMSLKEVDAGDIFVNPAASCQLLEWNGDTLLIRHKGGVKAYRFK